MLISCPSCHRQYDVAGMDQGEQLRCRCGKLIEVPRKKPRTARVLHCSGCGGHLKVKARNCDYCGSEITAAERNLGPPCPECFARLGKGAQFCSDCGVEIRPEAMKSSPVSASCPRCKGDLFLRELPTGHYTECRSCAGIWLDGKSFQRVVKEKDRSDLAAVFSLKTSGWEPHVDDQPVCYLPCPTCDRMMNRKNFGGGSGVIMDVCKDHGVWFDTHELEKIVAFVSHGGMERVRELETRRAREEEKRAEKTRKNRASPVYTSHGAPFGPGSHMEVDLFDSIWVIWNMLTRFMR